MPQCLFLPAPGGRAGPPVPGCRERCYHYPGNTRSGAARQLKAELAVRYRKYQLMFIIILSPEDTLKERKMKQPVKLSPNPGKVS